MYFLKLLFTYQKAVILNTHATQTPDVKIYVLETKIPPQKPLAVSKESINPTYSNINYYIFIWLYEV